MRYLILLLSFVVLTACESFKTQVNCDCGISKDLFFGKIANTLSANDYTIENDINTGMITGIKKTYFCYYLWKLQYLDGKIIAYCGRSQYKDRIMEYFDNDSKNAEFELLKSELETICKTKIHIVKIKQ